MAVYGVAVWRYGGVAVCDMAVYGVAVCGMAVFGMAVCDMNDVEV